MMYRSFEPSRRAPLGRAPSLFARLAALAALVTLAACGDGGGSTGAVCPTVDPPTYQTFGESFFTMYCTSCHSSTRTGAQRGGAPVGRDYDTLEGVRKELAAIDSVAASGPDGTFSSMPVGLPTPTLDQRKALGEFLACEKDR
ncbi:MAG: hypothetical protein R3B48_20325 [Kofleriaceae bacterium]